MNDLAAKAKLIFQDAALRRRLFFTLGALVVFRLLATIPMPGIDAEKLASVLSTNQFLGLFNIFSGGGLSNLSVVMLGVGPFITATIIMQLLTLMFPKLKEMYHEEGEAGRARFAQYSRLLTIPLALIQAFGFLLLLERQGVVAQLDTLGKVAGIITVAGGSLLLMWIGELITEFGIGNGVSLLIFAGIVSVIPTQASQLIFAFNPAEIPMYVGFLAVAVAVILGVVIVTEAERPVPVTYAKRVRGMKVYGGVSTYLPLRVNQAGVIPIIFALSLLILPQMLFQFLQNVPALASISATILSVLANQAFYAVFYFLLVFFFTYFYTAVTFDPEAISTNLQKSGAFIPGVRPGRPTALYLSQVLTRITLVGASFLSAIAVLPYIMQAVTSNQSLAIGGTSLLIVVSVVLDLVRRINAQVTMREY
jgi:preprotein translocase subunit SecY